MPNHFNFYIIQYYSFCKFSTFFCVQEHFLVPDHTITDINGASFAGFYYVCLQKSAATIEGYYYHRSSEWQVFIFFYKVCFKTSVKVKKVTKTMDFINSSQTLVCFHIHHKNSSLFLMHDLEKIKNLNRDRRISACPLGKQLTHFAFPGPLLARLRGCTHLVFGDQCLRTNTNWCCVHTLSTRYATVCIVTPFLPVRCHFET